MIRAVFRVEPEEKEWLRRCARSERVPMAEVLRRAVRQYRVRRDSPPAAPDQLLLWQDSELWAADDGEAAPDPPTAERSPPGAHQVPAQ